MTTHRRGLALVTSGLMLLSACGGGDDLSGADAELAEALAASWVEDAEFPPGVPVDCVAEGFVSGIGGADGAEGYGITTANIADADFDVTPLNEEDARAASTNMFGCDGFEAALLSEMGPGVTDEQATCLADNIDDGPLTALIATTFMGDNGGSIEAEFENVFETGLFAALETCGVDG